MNTDDLILISLYDHIVEPGNVFDEHLPAKWKAAAPRLERLRDNYEMKSSVGA